MELGLKTDTPQRSEAEQIAFFEVARVRALEAEERAGAQVVHLDVAGTRVALAFAGPRLRAAFMPALSHLVEPPDRTPDVTFHVWDSASTGVAMPPPPCPQSSFTHRGDIWGLSSTRIRSAFHWHEFSVNLYDEERREGIFWVNDPRALPYWSKASPLRTLFHWWMSADGAHLLHAAAFGTDEGALLLTGRGGTGKSTTALACLADGMAFASDDYLIVRLEPAPTVYSLYATAKLTPGQVERFPSLVPHLVKRDVPETDKAVVQLYPAFAAQLKRGIPLRAIATPIFADREETTLVAGSSSALQRSVAFTTLSQLPHSGRETHAFIQRLVRALPGFTLELGRAIERVPEAIQRHLSANDETLRKLASGDREADRAVRPLVSVIIPVYNSAHLLRDAVDSVLAQAWGTVEIIVVDDESEDDIQGAIDALPADVRFVRQPHNAGPAAARNRGVLEAAGELIAFIDADDLWTADHLEALAEPLLADPAVDVAHGRGQVTALGENGQPGEYLGNPQEAFPFYIGAGLYRRRAFEVTGVFDPELRFAEDTDWFQRAREAGLKIVKLDAVTLFVRRHEGNSTRGKSLLELNPLRVFKKQLDRQRQAGNAVPT